MSNNIEIMQQAVSLAIQVEQLSNSAKRASAAILESLQKTGGSLEQSDADAVLLTAEIELASLAVQSAITAPASAKPPTGHSQAEMEAAAASIAETSAGCRRASGLEMGLSQHEAGFQEYLIQIADAAADAAQNALSLYSASCADNYNEAISYACLMTMVCAGDVVRFTQMLQPKPSVSRLVIAS